VKKLVVISSYVATSRVGGAIAALIGPALDIDPVLIPTTLLGRHPGLGAPGGGAVADDMFASLIEGATANGALKADAILTGYFASAAQVHATAAFIDQALKANPDIRVIVDPIMGDTARGLYVSADVANAIEQELIPRASLCTPNMWEFSRVWSNALATPLNDIRFVADLARKSTTPLLVSSVRDDDQIGVIYSAGGDVWFAGSSCIDGQVPNGTGDVLTLAFTAMIINGMAPQQALSRAVGATHALIDRAVSAGASNLPLAQAQDMFSAPAECKVRHIN